ncbi:ABC transporter substrate-binding protein [Leucobacter chromiiresistens]|uniref:ABC transporter substrate-binding protein n=2 Tax=Leucobacter chromiiresistens TaxID=1079994 RepID=A0A147ELT4_9MICO|nr:ABC transporter substrate-binding protein [Leucobacter chromiiresistens]
MRMIPIISTLAVVTALAGCSGASPAEEVGAQGGGAGGGAFPMTIENCGTEVVLDSTPQRAVSLNQSATEILIALGVEDRVVGTAYQNQPVADDIAAAYESIPLLSDGILTLETLLEAQPDFVYSSFASFLTRENAGERAELHELGVPTYLTEFDCTYHEAVEGGATFEMLFDEIETIAKIFDVPEAGEQVVAEQQRIIDEGLATAEQIEGTPKLVWFYSTAASASTPSVAGPGGLPQTVTEMLGAKNLFDDADTKWPEVSWDEIAQRDPDVIILGDLTRGYPGDSAQEKIDFLKSDPLTRTMDAVINERFIVVPGQHMDPSIHSVEAITAVADGLVGLGSGE